MSQSELDHLQECLAQLPDKTDWQMVSLLAHHFRIPSGVSAELTLQQLKTLATIDYGTLKTREPETFIVISDLRPGDTFTLMGHTCTLKKHVRLPNRSPHLSGYFEYQMVGEAFNRNMDYATAWSHLTDGVMLV